MPGIKITHDFAEALDQIRLEFERHCYVGQERISGGVQHHSRTLEVVDFPASGLAYDFEQIVW
jgi:hypothetical protein